MAESAVAEAPVIAPATPAPVTPAVSATPATPAVAPEATKPTVEVKAEPEAAKPAEPAKVEPAKPIELISKADQLKMPEKLGEAEVEFLKSKQDAIAKSSIEGKVPLAEAQKTFENQLQNFRDVAAFGDARLKAMQATWVEQIKTDPKLGGDNLNRTTQLAERALTTLFGKEFYEKELKRFYMTSHPEYIRGLVKFAENAGDASLVALGEKPIAPAKVLTPGEKVYGVGYDPMNPKPMPKKF